MELSEIQAVFDRYREPLGELAWHEMCKVLTQPLPPTLWVNTTRITPQEISEWLIHDQHPISPIPFVPHGYRSSAPAKWGRRFEYRAGLIHLQEASSMLPPLALNPQPGELVLDLCAAPGGKSAQIASQLNHTGTLVVNDLSFDRLRALRATQERLGLKNMVLCAQDGRTFLQGHPPVFDKVLVDVPCSCEGTLRKRGSWNFEQGNQEFKRVLIETQHALLLQALRLTRPGGRVVYSTCTLDPEENEGVLNAALESWHLERKAGLTSFDVSLEELDISDLRSDDGLVEWKGKKWSESMRHARRVYPHQNDTGGFFLASLRVSDSTNALWDPQKSRQAWTQPDVLDQETEDQWMNWVSETYGIDHQKWSEVRKDSQLLSGTQRTYSLVNRDLILPPTSYQVAGLPVFYTQGVHPRLTSSAVLEWGQMATQQVFELSNRVQVDHYYCGNTQVLSTDQFVSSSVTSPLSKGVYIARYQGIPLGLGYLNHLEGIYQFKSEYPKRFRLAEQCSAFEEPLMVSHI